jgi:hypothetical protein
MAEKYMTSTTKNHKKYLALVGATAVAVGVLLLAAAGTLSISSAQAQEQVQAQQQADSAQIPPGLPPITSFSVTFENAGTYDYLCVIHPWMAGQVVVQ